MRLISAHVRGVGRLYDTKVNLDSRLIAIVGPNEAGKSTLVEALTRVGTGAALPPTRRSRGKSVSDDTEIITVDFVLDDEDIEGVAGLGLDIAQLPKRIDVSRRAGGGKAFVRTHPRPKKNPEPLRLAVAQWVRFWHRYKKALQMLSDGPDFSSEPFSSIESVTSWLEEQSQVDTPHASKDQLTELGQVIEAIEVLEVEDAQVALLRPAPHGSSPKNHNPRSVNSFGNACQNS